MADISSAPAKAEPLSHTAKQVVSIAEVAIHGANFYQTLVSERLAAAEKLLKEKKDLTVQQKKLLEEIVETDRLNLKSLGSAQRNLAAAVKDAAPLAERAMKEHNSGMFGSEKESANAAIEKITSAMRFNNVVTQRGLTKAQEAAESLERSGIYVFGDQRSFLQRNAESIQHGARITKAYGHLALQGLGTLPGCEWAIAASEGLLMADQHLQKAIRGKVDPEIPLLQATGGMAAIYAASKYTGPVGVAAVTEAGGLRFAVSAAGNVQNIVAAGSAVTIAAANLPQSVQQTSGGSNQNAGGTSAPQAKQPAPDHNSKRVEVGATDEEATRVADRLRGAVKADDLRKGTRPGEYVSDDVRKLANELVVEDLKKTQPKLVAEIEQRLGRNIRPSDVKISNKVWGRLSDPKGKVTTAEPQGLYKDTVTVTELPPGGGPTKATSATWIPPKHVPMKVAQHDPIRWNPNGVGPKAPKD